MRCRYLLCSLQWWYPGELIIVQARPDDNEIAWQYWRFLREKLRQPGRAIDLAARAHEHQAVVSALTGQPVRLRFLHASFSFSSVARFGVIFLSIVTQLQFAVDRARNLRASDKGNRKESKDVNGSASSSQAKSNCSIM